MTPPARRANRWYFYGPLIALAAAFGVYAILWSQAAAEMRRTIEKFTLAQRAHGVEIDHDALATRGFPFLLRGVVPNVRIAGGDWGWRAPALYVDAAPLSPDRLVFSTLASQRFDLGDWGQWRLDAEGARASVREDGRRAWILDMESGPARLAREDGDAPNLAAERFLLTMAPNTDDPGAVETSLIANGLSLDGRTRPVAASVIEAAFGVTAAEALGDADAWRAAGGALALRRIAIDAEGGRLYLAGRLTLDENGYPQGALNAEIVNPGAFALALGELGLIAPADAEAIAGALALAALASGGKIAAPLVFRDGEATIAGIRLAKLPRVE